MSSATVHKHLHAKGDASKYAMVRRLRAGVTSYVLSTKAERCSLSNFTAHFNFTAVWRQQYASRLQVLIPCLQLRGPIFVDPVKSLEYSCKVLVGNSCACIGNDDADLSLYEFSGNDNLASISIILNRIVDKVAEYVAEPLLVPNTSISAPVSIDNRSAMRR